jgi:hypothetical protein
MSKAPKNIEKVLLGVGLVAGGALGALGFLQLGAAEEDFSQSVPKPTDEAISVAGAEQVPGTINSLQSDRTLKAAEVPNEKLESGRRPVDLTVGVPLFANRDNPNQPVDPLTSSDIHDPIPNEWWLKHGIPPNFADSPQRDFDEDGFSNLEEFEAGTLPNDSTSHPELADKLAYLKEESVEWFLEFGMEMGGKLMPKIEIPTTGEKNKVDFSSPLEPGDTFFAEEPFKGRFKFLGIEERKEMNERLNFEETLKYGIFEDLKPNKKETKYEIPNRIPRAEEPSFYQYDRTAVLELQALGQEGEELRVEENTRFGLPKGAEDKKYLLKRVTPEEVEIEWEADGETRSLVIPKG